MAELNFVEYNANPSTHIVDDIVISLQGIGFNKISVSNDGRLSMWALNQCILMLNTNDKIETGLSGIGFSTSNSLDGSTHCSSSGLNVKVVNGLNIYTYPIELVKRNYDDHFKSLSPASVSTDLQYFAGMVINVDNINIVNELNDSLKLRVVKKSENYITSVCDHNRFNLLWNLGTKESSTIIIKTDDISDAVAKFVMKGFDSADITEDRQSEIMNIYRKDTDGLLPARHFVAGYQLNLSGKPKSYVVEKEFQNVLPNLNIVLSERHNHNGVNEESINYYATQRQIKSVVE